MPLFRRCDGELVKDIDPIRRMMPLVIRGRNESIIYHTTQWEIAKARMWLRNYNRARGDKAPASLFHLVAYASARVLRARPGLNRFVSGGSIYQRTGVWLSFAAKTHFTDEAPLKTMKLSFPENERFNDCVDRMTDAVKDGRFGRESRVEREVQLLTKLPGPLLRTVLAAGRGLDRVNLLPASLIETDPMYTSLFLASLGSIHIDNAFHHLYEYGTCSLFGVLGGVKKAVVAGRRGPEICEVLQTQWSFDERVNDGFYCVQSLEMLRRVMEDPQRYLEGEAEPVFSRSEDPLVPAEVPS